MIPTEFGLETSLLPSAFFQDPEGVQGKGPEGVFYWAISSNGLHGLPCLVVGGDSSVPGIIKSPLLNPKNAVARAGRTIYIFKVGPSGSVVGGRTLAADSLSGCIKKIEVGDLIGTP